MIIEFDSDRGKVKGQEYKVISKFNDRVYHVLASQGYYDWTVYNAVSDTVRIKVSNIGTEPVDAGVSNQIAIKPRLTITKPDSSSFWDF